METNQLPRLNVLLHGVAAQSDDPLLQLLLETAPQTINIRDINGWSVLHWGAAVGCYICLRTILTVPGLNATLATDRGENVFHFAAKRGDKEMIRIVSEHLTTDQARRDMPGQELDVYKLLTQAAVDDKTPLGLAQLHNHVDTALFLQTLIHTPGKLRAPKVWRKYPHS